MFVIAPEEPAVGLYKEDKEPYLRGDSGVDLFFPEDINIPSATEQRGVPTKVNLKVHIRFKEGISFKPWEVLPRSSIGKTTLGLANSIGLMDSGYKGPVYVAIRNFGPECTVKRGESLFQAVQPNREPAQTCIVSLLDRAFTEETARGDGHFGSTNKN